MAGLFASGRRTWVDPDRSAATGGAGRGPFKASRVISAERSPPRPPRRRAQCAGAPRRRFAVSGTRQRRRLDSGAAVPTARRPTHTVRPSCVARTRHRRHGLLRYPPGRTPAGGPEGVGCGLQGWGPLGFGEARAGGAPRGTLTADPRTGKGRRLPAWLRREGASAAAPVPTCRVVGPPVGVPWPPLRQRGGAGAWSVIGPARGGGWGGRQADGQPLCKWDCVCPVGVLAPGTAE